MAKPAVEVDTYLQRGYPEPKDHGASRDQVSLCLEAAKGSSVRPMVVGIPHIWSLGR